MLLADHSGGNATLAACLFPPWRGHQAPKENLQVRTGLSGCKLLLSVLPLPTRPACRTARPAPSSGPSPTVSWGSCRSCRQACQGVACRSGSGYFLPCLHAGVSRVGPLLPHCLPPSTLPSRANSAAHAACLVALPPWLTASLGASPLPSCVADRAGAAGVLPLWPL